MKEVAVIKVRNAQRGLRFELGSLHDFSERALQICQHRHKGKMPEQIEVLLVSDRRIAALHKKFMNIAGPTDVITFQHGEIFVGVETAKRNARRFRTSTEEEIRLYIVHGLLHLLGFDDKSPAKARRMEAAQRRILASALRAGR